MNRISELRQKKGWTQDDLASRLGVSRQAVGHYETDTRGIDAQKILILCDIFGCTADYLLGRSPLPSYALTPEEESLLLAFRASDQRAREMVLLALHPFWQEAGAAKAT